MNKKNNDYLSELGYVPRRRVIYAKLKAPFAWSAQTLFNAVSAIAVLLKVSTVIGGCVAAVLTVFLALSGASGSGELVPASITWWAVFTAGIFGFLVLGRIVSALRD